MNRMSRKALRSFLVCLCVTILLSIGNVFATDFTHCADDLADLGIFKGGTTGYELDRAPTRAEAATMLVRLLGKESEALATPYTAPFTDVLPWAQPYVGWLYKNGMTQGMSATTYAPSTICTAQMYATFCLRALGYDDATGDFTYAHVLDFAEKVGVVDDGNCDTKNGFLRNNLAAVSLTTLRCPTKNSEQSLLKLLTNQGAISRVAAQPLLNRFNMYDAYANAVNIFNNDLALKSVSLTDLSVYQHGILLDKAHMETKSCAMYNPMAPETSLLSAVTSIDYLEVSEFYYRDGVGYRSLYGQTSQHEMSYARAIDGIDRPEDIPLCYLTDIRVEEKDGEYFYTLSLDPTAASEQLTETADALGFADALQAQPSVDKLSYVVVLRENGMMRKQILNTEFALVLQGIPTTAEIVMTTYLGDYGEGIYIEFPDDLTSW